MIKDLVKLVEVLNKKVPELVEAIEKTNPTTDAYGKLIESYAGTMQLISTLNRTLAEIAVTAKENTMEEGATNESNN